MADRQAHHLLSGSDQDVEEYHRRLLAPVPSWAPQHRMDSSSSSKRKADDDLQREDDRALLDNTEEVYRETPSEKPPKRASQACLRCRRQKLRCLGGWPCKRCEKNKSECDFGRPPQLQPPPVDDSKTRLAQLESSVASLLAGLANPNQPLASMHQHSSVPAKRSNSFGQSRVLPPPNLPNPSHLRSAEAPRFPETQQALDGPGPSRVHFLPSPTTSSGVSYHPSGAGPFTDPSPSAYTGSPPVPPTASAGLNNIKSSRVPTAETRLAAATHAGDEFEPPFKALVYQPSVWDNREQSRRASPQPSAAPSREESQSNFPIFERRTGSRDDAVNTDIITMDMAECLFAFYGDHCHAFLPIIDLAIEDPFGIIQHESPLLFSAMIAIAARFYIRHVARFPVRPDRRPYPQMDRAVPAQLAHLAESHLANTLLRKNHTLHDVQATLLMAGWGLQSGGKGPDAWVVTGLSARLARRLGIHTRLKDAAESARQTDLAIDTEEAERLEALMPQWRTWLCWFCYDGQLSLGFGRPQSTQLETVDEHGFLQLRLRQQIPRPGSGGLGSNLHGDVYIAGMVQLTQIGRDMINWGELLSERAKRGATSPPIKNGRDLSLSNMFRELNARLDDWSRTWVWTGSPYALYLGPSTRLARLQSEHMRLCLNSFALKSTSSDSPGDDVYAGPEGQALGQCLKKALNSAMSTIQTHYESSQTDLALSYAIDYITITLAQAAIFLVRLNHAISVVKTVIQIDTSVIAHFLRMSVDLLEQAELSETRVSTYLAKTIRDISRAAGINGLGDRTELDDPAAVDRPHTATSYPPSLFAAEPNPMHMSASAIAEDLPGGEIAPFDLESFLQYESQLDLGYLLGLPGDGAMTSSGMYMGWQDGGGMM